ncbi:MAG: hypothetical protein IEMM0002_0800 [bacterium]|nr:MAG: hypothetical protein IEMM0002_0800 [bacterium]
MIPVDIKTSIDYPIPDHANRLGYSLGGISLSVFKLLFISGVILAYFGYQPSPEGAHQSMLFIDGSWLLSIIRSVHSLSSEFFIILIILHATRVVLSKSYHGQRRITWNAGILLAAVAAGFFFTGSVLKWDQEGYEALGHVLWTNNMLPFGGYVNNLLFSGNVPLKIFVAHAVLLPAVLLIVVSVHLLCVKILKISPRNPAHGEPAQTSSFGRHLRGLAGYSLIAFGVIVIAAVFYTPPLLDAPYSGVEWTKPPWPFLFLYTLENWFGMWILLAIPPVIFLSLFGLPYLSKPSDKWDAAQILYFAMLVLFLVLILAGAWSKPVQHMM